MTNRQRQNLLQFLERYDPGTPDGIWGDRSRRAMEAFQRDHGLQVTGTGNDATDAALLSCVASWEPEQEEEPKGTFWDEIEFFTREEFRCQCGGRYCDGFPVEPQKQLVRTVDEIRRRLGVPVSIVDAGGSGVRCPVHNANVGGAQNSNHLYGNAADLHSSKSSHEMAKVAEQVLGNTGELGIYSWGIHVGVNCKHSRFNG